MSNFKRITILAICCILLFVSLTNLDNVFNFIKNIIGLILPVVAGGIIAFVLSVPLNGIKKIFSYVLSKINKNLTDKTLDRISLVVLLICVSILIVLIGTVVIPEIVLSVKNIPGLIEEHIPQWINFCNENGINIDNVKGLVPSLDLSKFVPTLFGSAGSVLNSVLDVSSSIISGIYTSAVTVVIAIYMLSTRKTLARQSKKLLYAHIKQEYADKIASIMSLVKETYAKFLSGQCVEAIILGVLIFISFSVFNIPYAGLIAILTSFFAFVPYIGAFAACIIGAFLILLSNPSQTLICIIVYIVVQFVENQFIYPRVVGSSVGLSPLWTLIAVLIGGKLFGPIGMVFSIPLFSVIYALISKSTNKKLDDRNINIS